MKLASNAASSALFSSQSVVDIHDKYVQKIIVSISDCVLKKI